MDDKTIWIVIGALLFFILFIAIIQLGNDVKRTNLILEKIAKKIGAATEPSEDDEIKTLIAERKKNEAIKRYREITGAGLKEANDYIEKLI